MSGVDKLGSILRSEMHKVSKYNIGIGNTALAQITSGNGLKIDGLDYTIPHSDYLISKSCAEVLTPGERVLVAFFNDEPIVVDIVGQNLKKHDHNGVYSTVSDFNNLSKTVENIGSQQQTQGGLIGETSQFISSLADYDVEQGTSGVFNYIKKASGLVECWGEITRKTTPWGTSSLFSGGGVYTTTWESFPFTITQIDSVVANCTIGHQQAVAHAYRGECLANQLLAVNAQTNLTGEQPCVTQFIIKGRWR